MVKLYIHTHTHTLKDAKENTNINNRATETIKIMGWNFQ